jgi:hypothetical protein
VDAGAEGEGRSIPEDAARADPEKRRRDGPREWRDLVDIYPAKKLPTLKPERWPVQSSNVDFHGVPAREPP